MTKETPPLALEQSQKKLYLAVKRELALYEKKKKKELRAYERAFRSSLPKKFRSSDRQHLIRAVAGAKVVLVGDFHPFRQSQKGFVRLIESSALQHSRPVIALECFQQAHQAAINEFMSGLITADELRDKIDFERYWPFSWENYREILVFARKNRMPVLGLNIAGRRGKDSDLHARDAAAAERIARELGERPASTIYVLYGELHLGRNHLPRELRARLGRHAAVVTVHQNDAELYWRAPTLADGQKPEVLRLGPAEYCIQNSVPWVKLRSYLDWLEGSPAPDLDDEELDVVGVVHHYARLLADAAGLPASIDDGVELLPPDRLTRKALPRLLNGLRSPDRGLALHALAFHRTGYLPGRAAFLLPTVSTNSMSEAASYLLQHSLRGGTVGSWGSDEWISHFMLGYLGSKILNPKRKCNEVADLRRLAVTGGGLRASADRSEIAGRALSLLRPFLRDASPSARRKRLNLVREIEACRTAGFVLGERFFLALLARPALLGRLREMFRRGPGRATLRDAAKELAKLRRAGPSKLEKF